MARLPVGPAILCAVATLGGWLGSVGISPVAHAATRMVTNCDNSGPGSLRAVAAAANSGDTIDLRSLTCSPIRLTTGPITLPDEFITIVGAGESRTRIDGNGTSRVLVHASPTWGLNTGATLRLRRLTIQNGLQAVANDTRGGCIYAARHIRLEYVHVRNCIVRATDPAFQSAFGGGLYSAGRTVLFHSAVYDNRAEGTEATGGGLVGGLDLGLHIDHSSIHRNYSGGDAGGAQGPQLTITYSTIRDNVAEGIGGGIIGSANNVQQNVINKSTISGNVARHHAGLAVNGSTLISDSTISGNRSQQSPAGLSLDGRGATVYVRNSTIADNIALTAFTPGQAAGGVHQFGTVRWQSSIVADNFLGSEPADLWAQVAFGATVLGSDNLIETSNAPLPSDTLRVDPMLGPLADNGGRTRTHALPADSPAVDAGNNNANYAFDQRGEGFPRVVNGRADIGAYEVQAP
jgi:hypothetical protein